MQASTPKDSPEPTVTRVTRAGFSLLRPDQLCGRIAIVQTAAGDALLFALDRAEDVSALREHLNSRGVSDPILVTRLESVK